MEKYQNLKYEDATILMAEIEEEPKSLLMKIKEESEEADLKLNIDGEHMYACGGFILIFGKSSTVM